MSCKFSIGLKCSCLGFLIIFPNVIEPQILFQTRIKKIMQTDEDVGKIAMAVPLLVCKLIFFFFWFFSYSFVCTCSHRFDCLKFAAKALELFLQDLCNHTYDVTLSRGAKTLNSVHL